MEDCTKVRGIKLNDFLPAALGISPYSTFWLTTVPSNNWICSLV